MKAIRVHRYGGPETLELEDIPVPQPVGDQVRVKLEAIGLNYIDTYHRTGLYPLSLPFTPGMEGAGVVDAVGEGVNEVQVGDRVGYVMELGSYAEYSIVPASKLVVLPPSLDSRSAAAALLQGMTAHYLTRSAYPLKEREVALVHAAAGGVGLLLTQMARRSGARVLTTVSTEAKARLAKEAGADATIPYTQTDFAEEVKRLTGGEGVHVVYDSVGKTTFEKSLECLRPRGYLILFGQSSGPVPPFNLATLAAKGSLYVTRPNLAHYVGHRQELMERARDLFNWLSTGALKLRVEKTLPLSEAREAHRQLEGRKTTGKVLLIP